MKPGTSPADLHRVPEGTEPHEVLVPTRAEYLRGYIKARRHQRRAELIKMLGRVCVRCGATEDLEFDHIDPSTKRFAVGSDMSRAWDELVAEARKCQLLCPPCHLAKAREDRPEPAHSYYRYWYYGCRCEICRAANAAKSARLRARRLNASRHERGETVD